jgi:short-subunit dehydrogenase
VTRPLAVVTGASTGIGLELARCCIADGYDAIVCAEEPAIEAAAAELRRDGASVEAVQADLATEAGIAKLVAAIGERPVDALLANAGVGLGDAFLDQDLRAAENVVNLNVNGTIALVHVLGRRMRDRGEGRILITGSIAGFLPGSFQAVYNGTKAFLDSFSLALGNELKDSGVTVTCLMPGPTDTEFFERADMLDTPVGRSDDKADPADVARQGYKAMKAGKSGVVTGFMNKVQTVFSGIIPDTVLAEMHRRTAEPGRR